MSEQTHAIAIDRLAARCDALAGAEVAARLRMSLDSALTDRLPPALAKAAEPVFEGRDGVVRIRRLALRLDLGEVLEAEGIAALLAGRIAAALRQALEQGSNELRTWPDHDAYLAEYLAMRLGILATAAWPFADLAKLEHLPAERAAAECIRARPELLRPLARIAVEAGAAADAPVANWPLVAQAALSAALLAPQPSAAETAALAQAVQELAPLARARAPQPTAEALAADALRLTLVFLASAPQPLPPRAVATAAVALLALRAELEAWNGDRSIGAGTGGNPGAQRSLHRARELVARDTASKSMLDTIRRNSTARSHLADSSPPAAVDGQTGTASDAVIENLALATPYAGLALLMPSVLTLGALDCLGKIGLAQAVWQALAADDWELAAQDPALALLYPVDPREIDLAAPQPEPPTQLQESLADNARPVYAAADPARRWSALLLADFASRLRGLQASSHNYLRAQFLRRRGSITREAKTLRVELDPLPLAIVLHMAGHASPPPLLPHLGGRRLDIDFGGRG